MQLRPNIGEHDLVTKIRATEKLLAKGCTVQFIMFFRGREFSLKDVGIKILRRIASDLKDQAVIDPIKVDEKSSRAVMTLKSLKPKDKVE